MSIYTQAQQCLSADQYAPSCRHVQNISSSSPFNSTLHSFGRCGFTCESSYNFHLLAHAVSIIRCGGRDLRAACAVDLSPSRSKWVGPDEESRFDSRWASNYPCMCLTGGIKPSHFLYFIVLMLADRLNSFKAATPHKNPSHTVHGGGRQ